MQEKDLKEIDKKFKKEDKEIEEKFTTCPFCKGSGHYESCTIDTKLMQNNINHSLSLVRSFWRNEYKKIEKPNPNYNDFFSILEDIFYIGLQAGYLGSAAVFENNKLIKDLKRLSEIKEENSYPDDYLIEAAENWYR